MNINKRSNVLLIARIDKDIFYNSRFGTIQHPRNYPFLNELQYSKLRKPKIALKKFISWDLQPKSAIRYEAIGYMARNLCIKQNVDEYRYVQGTSLIKYYSEQEVYPFYYLGNPDLWLNFEDDKDDYNFQNTKVCKHVLLHRFRGGRR